MGLISVTHRNEGSSEGYREQESEALALTELLEVLDLLVEWLRGRGLPLDRVHIFIINII